MVDMKAYDKTALTMLPVCNCGYIFRDGIVIHTDICEKNGVKYAVHAIEPSMCPNCKKQIESISEKH